MSNVFPNGVDRVSGGLSEEQRRALDRLEARAGEPTGWERGQLAAILLAAGGDDRRRAEELRARWGRPS